MYAPRTWLGPRGIHLRWKTPPDYGIHIGITRVFWHSYAGMCVRHHPRLSASLLPASARRLLEGPPARRKGGLHSREKLVTLSVA